MCCSTHELLVGGKRPHGAFKNFIRFKSRLYLGERSMNKHEVNVNIFNIYATCVVLVDMFLVILSARLYNNCAFYAIISMGTNTEIHLNTRVQGKISPVKKVRKIARNIFRIIRYFAKWNTRNFMIQMNVAQLTSSFTREIHSPC